jgi:hypothetical protein
VPAVRRAADAHRPGAWWWPLRLAFGAFFLHTALDKRGLDERGAEGLHAFAASAYPQLRSVAPRTFVHGMTVAESAIATSLLVPVVPATVGAAGLTAFGAGLVGTYWRAPGLRAPGSVRPTPAGLGVAKDSWMVAAGLALLLDATLARRPGRRSPTPDTGGDQP